MTILITLSFEYTIVPDILPLTPVWIWEFEISGIENPATMLLLRVYFGAGGLTTTGGIIGAGGLSWVVSVDFVHEKTKSVTIAKTILFIIKKFN